MPTQPNKMISLSPALGLVFGSGAGLLTAVLTGWDIATTVIIGAAPGLVAGSIVYSLSKKDKK